MEISSLASVFRMVVLPALSSPSSRILSSRSDEDFSFLPKSIVLLCYVGFNGKFSLNIYLSMFSSPICSEKRLLEEQQCNGNYNSRSVSTGIFLFREVMHCLIRNICSEN